MRKSLLIQIGVIILESVDTVRSDPAVSYVFGVFFID